MPKMKLGGGLEGEGYCGSSMGTQTYSDGIAMIKPVLEQSKCHTLDRFNWHAQRDPCGIPDKEVWSKGVEANFTLEHHPYMVLESTRKCIEIMSANSLFNMVKSGAIQLTATLIISLIAWV